MTDTMWVGCSCVWEQGMQPAISRVILLRGGLHLDPAFSLEPQVSKVQLLLTCQATVLSGQEYSFSRFPKFQQPLPCLHYSNPPEDVNTSISAECIWLNVDRYALDL